MTDTPESLTPAPGLFRRLWTGYLRRHSPTMALAFLFMIAEGSTLGLLSWMLKPLFDRVFTGGDANAVWWVGGAIFGLFLMRATTTVVNRTLIARVSTAIAARMQTDLLRHALTLDGRFFQSNPPGALIERIQGDTAAVQNVWTNFIMAFGRDVVALVTLFGVAISVDPWWTLSAMVGAPLLILPSLAVKRYVRRKAIQVRAQASLRATRLDEVFHGVNAIKLNRNEDHQIDRFGKVVRSIARAEVKAAASRATMPALIDVVTGLGFFLVLVLGGRQIAGGERTVGEFMSFFTAMALAFQPLRRLGDMAGSWQVAATSLVRIYALFDTQASVRSPVPGVRADRNATEIRFEDVSLSYDDVPALNGISFVAEAGKTTALVGPSGAGKTTVFTLLTRLADPDSGRILLGGHDLRTLDLGSLRDMFSVVSQEPALFDETIRDNILLGQDRPEEAVRRAADAAHVSAFVEALPFGLDTPAGPRGSALSGGQRQRVAIARALLRDAPILLLDEATSALDAASEAAVQEALDRLSHDRTTLVIAHRLATVRRADRILVLDRGRVVEEGTHEGLLAAGGLYAELCRLQFTE